MTPDGSEAESATEPRITRDPVSLITGTLVGIAGLLFLFEPVAPAIPVGGARLRPVVLSGIVFALALTFGGIGYLSQGRTRIGLGHAGMAAGWILVVLATAVGAAGLLVAGVVLIAGTGLYLAAQARDAGS